MTGIDPAALTSDATARALIDAVCRGEGEVDDVLAELLQRFADAEPSEASTCRSSWRRALDFASAQVLALAASSLPVQEEAGLAATLVEFDAWLSFRGEFREVLTAFREAFGTDTSAAAPVQDGDLDKPMFPLPEMDIPADGEGRA